MQEVQTIPGEEPACAARGRMHGQQPWFRKDGDARRRPYARDAKQVASARRNTDSVQLSGRNWSRPVVSTAVEVQGAFTLMAEDAACSSESKGTRGARLDAAHRPELPTMRTKC